MSSLSQDLMLEAGVAEKPGKIAGFESLLGACGGAWLVEHYWRLLR